VACAGVALCLAAAWAFEPGSEAFRLQGRDVPALQPSSIPPELVDVQPDSTDTASVSAPAAPRPSAPFATGRLIRVALDEGKAAVTCDLRGAWFSPSGQKLTGKATARLDPQGVVVETMTAKVDLGSGGVLRSDAGTFCFGPKCFRGQVRFERLGNGIALVNQLSLEDYLIGVVPGEIGRRLDPRFAEAIRAQAIVARTYTLRSLGQYTGKPWDVRDDVRDQVYDGLKGEDPLCTGGVRSTTGQILTDASGRPIDAYYHSTSGGHTADIRDVWPGKAPQPYLSGVYDTAPDGRSWGGAALVSEWAERWPVDQLHEAVRRDLSEALGRKVDPGPVKALRLEGRDPSGRARKLVVEAENGIFEVPSDRIRWALRRTAKGRPILRSTRFELEVVNGEYLAEGTGYGHGVGMSQNGAMGRAFAGQTYNQILSAYYPGTVLRTIEP
jgi:stage II sporulation protein D